MARLVPNPIPSTVLENPFRSAEIEVYEGLGRQLEDGFVVYYSRPWLGLNPQGAEREGEADFVVAHPEHGAVVIEVKGGRIGRDGNSDHWSSTDRFGVKHEIRNPVEQANRSKHVLTEKLRSHPRLRGRNVRLAHGVIFPHVRAPGSDLGVEMPKDIFVFANEMGALRAWIIARCRSVTPRSGVPVLGSEGMAVLDELLGRSFTLHPSLMAALDADDRKIDALTVDQFQLLEQIEAVPRAWITGGAGTGKTILALEKAHRLAEAGKTVLLACASGPLASHLKSVCRKSERITVHAIGELARKRGFAGLRGDDGAWSDETASELLAALSRTGGGFDAVVLDEGQDVSVDVLEILELALRSPREGTFYVFFDDCQRIAGALSPTPRDRMPLRLGRNLRNTKQIFEAARPYYRGSITGHGPVGVPVEWVALPGQGKWAAAVESRIGQLIGRERVPPSQMAVLTGSEEGRDVLRGTQSLRSHAGPALGTTPSVLMIETVRDFKGLERRVVLLCDLEPIVNQPELLYVALTRARVHLIVIGTNSQLALTDLGGTRPRLGSS